MRVGSVMEASAANAPDGAVWTLIKSFTFAYIRSTGNKSWQIVRIKTYKATTTTTTKVAAAKVAADANGIFERRQMQRA